VLIYPALDRIFLALADPMCRYIVECLCDGEESVGSLADRVPYSLPGLLQHLRVLEQSGLIRTYKRGRVRICCIEPQALALLDRWLTERRRIWDPWLRRLRSGG